MGQLMIVAEYLIDTCSILAQKSDRGYKRKVCKTGWKFIDDCLESGKIVICSEIEEEVRDPELKQWLNDKQCIVIDINDEIQENVRMIVTENPKMIKFNNNGNNTSSGDAFLIATAICHNLSIITEEDKKAPNKIPQICGKYGIQTYSIVDFWEKEGLTF